MSKEEAWAETVESKGDLYPMDPVGNLGRLALSTQGTHDRAIEWLKRDNARIEETRQSEIVKTRNIGKNNEAISWLQADKRRLGG